MTSSISLPIENGTKNWLDITAPTPEDLSSLATRFNLHPAFVKDCLDPSHLPKFEVSGDARFIIVRAYDENAPNTAETTQALTRKTALFIGPFGVITVHRADQSFIKKLRNDWNIHGPKRTQRHLVNAFLSEVIRSYQPLIYSVSEQLDRLEKNVFHKKTGSKIFSQVYRFKRVTTVVEQTTRMLEETILQLIQSQNHPLDHETPFERDLIDQARRLLLILDDLQIRTDQILQLHLAIETQRNNDVIRVLTLFSAFFLPLTFIAGIYGMNFKHMPELDWAWGYGLTLLFMLLVSLGIGVWFWKKGWLK